MKQAKGFVRKTSLHGDSETDREGFIDELGNWLLEHPNVVIMGLPVIPASNVDPCPMLVVIYEEGDERS